MSFDDILQNVELALVRLKYSEKSSSDVQQAYNMKDRVCEDCGKQVKHDALFQKLILSSLVITCQFPNVTVARRHILVKHFGYRYICPLCQGRGSP